MASAPTKPGLDPSGPLDEGQWRQPRHIDVPNAPFDVRSDMQNKLQPFVSAVICTRNRPDKIGNAVESVLANTYPNFDLTIIDQSTNGETEAISRRVGERDRRIRYQRMSKSGLSRAYNLAIASTTGPIIAFTDDDCVVPSDWIEKIVTAFEEQRDGELMYGQVLPVENGGMTPFLYIGKPERMDRANGFRVFGMGANFAARRSLFERAGTFDEMLGGGGPLKSSQDFDLAYRAYRRNAAILLRPEVVVRHDGRREHEDWPTLLRAYGFGDGAFYSKHVRCRDPYAAWLAAKNFGVMSAKFVAKRAVGRRPAEINYLSGFVEGVRGGLKFGVDRATLLYTEKN
jgi:glycosyltransferase involved in cell wall biosynthesis